MAGQATTIRLGRWVALLALLLATPAMAALPMRGSKLPIWQGPAPGGALATTPELEEPFPFGPHLPITRNVSRPTLTVFPADPTKATGASVIIAPGGGFLLLMDKPEGSDLADWLASRGVTAFVLRYRLAATPVDAKAFAAQAQAMLAELKRTNGRLQHSPAAKLAEEDGRQAIRFVRGHAAEWGLDPKRVGIIGFSAGGEIAAGVAMHHDALSRPDFAAPVYAGLSSVPEAPSDAPPLFLALAADDQLLGVAPSEQMFAAWRAANKPVELHVFSDGGHGFGMVRKAAASDHWIEALAWWLQAQGVLSP